MTTIYTNNNTIEIPFPNTIFTQYLREINLKSEKDLNDVTIFLIIKKAYSDFKNGILSLDNFSSIGGFLFNHIKEKSGQLANILLEIEELNFYIRNVDPKISEPKESLLNIDQYFKQHEQQK